MKVWAANRYYKDEIHGDQLSEIKLFKTIGKAQVYINKQEQDPCHDFYYILEEYEVEQ